MSAYYIGETITIYQDPYTQEKPEGEARLVRRLDNHGNPEMERWRVAFLTDREVTYDRWILKDAVDSEAGPPYSGPSNK